MRQAHKFHDGISTVSVRAGAGGLCRATRSFDAGGMAGIRICLSKNGIFGRGRSCRRRRRVIGATSVARDMAILE